MVAAVAVRMEEDQGASARAELTAVTIDSVDELIRMASADLVAARTGSTIRCSNESTGVRRLSQPCARTSTNHRPAS